MNTALTIQQTESVRFTLSPKLKTIVAQKAKAAGLTLSELGRHLFGAYAKNEVAPPPKYSKRFLKIAKEAEEEYRQGKGVICRTPEELSTYLKSLE